MPGYDPKQKRAHSPAAAEGPAPVDDLLGAAAPTAAGVDADAERPGSPVTGAARPPVPEPVPAARPDPRVIAVAAGLVVAAVLLWRRRRP